MPNPNKRQRKSRSKYAALEVVTSSSSATPEPQSQQQGRVVVDIRLPTPPPSSPVDDAEPEVDAEDVLHAQPASAVPPPMSRDDMVSIAPASDRDDFDVRPPEAINPVSALAIDLLGQPFIDLPE